MTHSRLSKLAVLILFVLVEPSSGYSETSSESRFQFDWKVVSTSNNLTVYEAKGERSGTVPIRFHTVLDYQASRVRAVLADTIRRPEWTPNMVEARVLENMGQDGKIEYLRYNFPWPFRDRTFVLLNKSSYDPSDRTLTSTTRSTDHPASTDSGKFIRALTLDGKVITRPTSDGDKTHMEAIFHTDVRGNIPGWLFHLIQRSWPKKVVKNLNRQLARDDIKIEDRWLLLDP